MVAIDVRDEGLELAKQCGVDVVVDARTEKEDVVKRAQAVTTKSPTTNAGADATITLADVDSAAALACAVTKMHGTKGHIAQPDQVKILFAELIFRDIRVKGSVLAFPWRNPRDARIHRQARSTSQEKVFYGLEQIHDLVDATHRGQVQGKGTGSRRQDTVGAGFKYERPKVTYFNCILFGRILGQLTVDLAIKTSGSVHSS